MDNKKDDVPPQSSLYFSLPFVNEDVNVLRKKYKFLVPPPSVDLPPSVDSPPSADDGYFKNLGFNKKMDTLVCTRDKKAQLSGKSLRTLARSWFKESVYWKDQKNEAEDETKKSKREFAEQAKARSRTSKKAKKKKKKKQVLSSQVPSSEVTSSEVPSSEVPSSEVPSFDVPSSSSGVGGGSKSVPNMQKWGPSTSEPRPPMVSLTKFVKPNPKLVKPKPPKLVKPKPPKLVKPKPPKLVKPKPPKLVNPKPPKFLKPNPPTFVARRRRTKREMSKMPVIPEMPEIEQEEMLQQVADTPPVKQSMEHLFMAIDMDLAAAAAAAGH